MPARSVLKKSPFFFAVSGLFFADQLSKRLVLHYLSEQSSVPVVPGVFHLTRVNNTGAAFGLFRGAGVFLIAVTAASAVLFSVYVLARWECLRSWQRAGWILVIGGALGNLYDRFTHRHVVDFLDFRVWPVFNLADAFVCTGVALIFLSAFKK